jgi:DNA-binding MarR family transcriptional regulator
MVRDANQVKYAWPMPDVSSPPAGPPPADLPPSLLDVVVQLTFNVHRRISDVAARHDLTVTGLRLLGILRDREPTMLELAGLLGLTKSSMSGLIDRAERRGHLGRVGGHDDGRVIRVRLTSAGQALAATLADDGARELATLLAPLSAADQASLSRLLAPITE